MCKEVTPAGTVHDTHIRLPAFVRFGFVNWSNLRHSCMSKPADQWSHLENTGQKSENIGILLETGGVSRSRASKSINDGAATIVGACCHHTEFGVSDGDRWLYSGWYQRCRARGDGFKVGLPHHHQVHWITGTDESKSELSWSFYFGCVFDAFFTLTFQITFSSVFAYPAWRFRRFYPFLTFLSFPGTFLLFSFVWRYLFDYQWICRSVDRDRYLDRVALSDRYSHTFFLKKDGNTVIAFFLSSTFSVKSVSPSNFHKYEVALSL